METKNKRHAARTTELLPRTEESTQDTIRALAYHLFCECGYEHGHDLEHWLKAEQTVLGQSQTTSQQAA